MPRSSVAVALALALLAGCASTPPRVVVQQVKVPVPVQVPCPIASVPARPALPIATLTPASAPSNVMRAYVASLAMVQGYAAQLEALLGAKR